MSAKTNSITVDGTAYYSVQGKTNPKKAGSNPNGAILDLGAYLEVVAPAEGIDFVPGEYKKLSSYEAKTFTHTVNYTQLNGKTIYVAPNGTADEMIYMIADKNATERPVFDFQKKCAGMILAGNYWYFQGFDVTNSADATKGINSILYLYITYTITTRI